MQLAESIHGRKLILKTCKSRNREHIRATTATSAQWRTKSLSRKVSFSRYLRDARARRGLSASDVAEQIGVSTSSIYFWETDCCRPRDANLTALCKVLKLPIRATRALAEA
jgi:DNA-binding XRE family transcriptional regulator